MPLRSLRRLRLAERSHEVRQAAFPIVQASLAAGIAWSIATELFGHVQPFFAPISAIICLGATHFERGRRTGELLIGVTLGIAIAEVLVTAIGVGTVQLVASVALAMAAAVFVGGGPILIAQASVSAVLVLTLQPVADGISVGRMVDAFTGGLVGIAISVALPVDPLRLVRKTVRPLLDDLAGVLDDVAIALDRRDGAAGQAALQRARTLDERASAYYEAVTAAAETATYAPPRWRARDHLAAYVDAHRHLDNAVRNTRVLARGAVRALQLGDHVPDEIGTALRELAVAVRSLERALAANHVSQSAPARAAALRAAGRATLVLERTGNLSVSVLVGQLRSTAVDLLRGLGLDGDEARAAVRMAAREVAAATATPPPEDVR